MNGCIEGPLWAMPRDMSKFSDLEAAMLAAINAAGLPEPTPEYRFDEGCCVHEKRQHKRGLCQPCAQIDINSQPGLGRVHWILGKHEYKPGRKWRFDFAWPDLMVAIECEGGTYAGGRHTTGDGFEKDAEKYAEAAARGWTVLRFTQRQITSGAALEVVERVLSAHREVV